MAGDVTLRYNAYDIDNDHEVVIFLNAEQVCSVPTTDNNAWSVAPGNTCLLPDTLVSDLKENILTFNNTFNPPKSHIWGVADLEVTAAGP